jgi:hypothetical protein
LQFIARGFDGRIDASSHIESDNSNSKNLGIRARSRVRAIESDPSPRRLATSRIDSDFDKSRANRCDPTCVFEHQRYHI